MNITGHTRLFGIVARPIRHSFSPMMHNRAFDVLGLDNIYLAFEIEDNDLASAIQGFRALGVQGANISMPFKQAIIPYLDELDISAKLCNAVNTIVLKDNKYIGYSSDGYGFMESLRDQGIDLVDKKLMVAGSGGAALAIIAQASLDKVGEIIIYKRRVEEQAFIDQIKVIQDYTNAHIEIKNIEDQESLKQDLVSTTVFVNATSVGMAPNSDASIILDSSYFHKGLCVVDIIYNPLETKLLKQAKQAGAKTMNGKPMLLFQGARAFELFTGQKMPIEEIKKLMEI
ncbi:shikimate dehydrogenase [Tannockella kyphosi]|uniref:shikimate dehydrogenase n=1 Tax=Tannockella kyphosi TaxID=2899121 RepID=UPI0020118CE8|nr:shikimate dehydrogenase [Tannockella kyphosi]